MRPFVVEWPQTAQHLLQRVHRESVGRLMDEKTSELLRALASYPDVESDWVRPGSVTLASTAPIIPLSFSKDGVTLNYFSMVTTVGAPRAVSAQELRIECMFPADEVSEVKHVQMLAQ